MATFVMLIIDLYFLVLDAWISITQISQLRAKKYKKFTQRLNKYLFFAVIQKVICMVTMGMCMVQVVTE